MTFSAIDRLAELRPCTPATASRLVTNAERDAVLDAVMASGPARRPRVLRRRVAWGLAGTAAAVGLVAALVLTLILHVPSPPRPSTTFVLAAARHALDNRRSGIVKIIVTAPGSDTQVEWFDLANKTSRTDEYHDGRLDFTSYNVANRQVNVDYTTKAWGATPPGSVALSGFGLTRQGIERALRNGTFTLTGMTMLDGREALVLTGNASGQVDQLWVDRATYLPVRQTLSTGKKVDATMRYSWYSTTKRLLRMFVVAIPPGFTHTSGHGRLP